LVGNKRIKKKSTGTKEKIKNPNISQTFDITSRTITSGNISINQLNTFSSILKFEKKNTARIGEPSEFAKKFEEEMDAKKEFFMQRPKLIAKEYFKTASTIKIPAIVPLKLPDSIIKLVKENKIGKISVISDRATNQVKVSFTGKDGTETILATNQENSFKNHSAATETGLKISEDSKLNLFIPLSSTSLESSSSNNQGNVLYKVNLMGVG